MQQQRAVSPTDGALADFSFANRQSMRNFSDARMPQDAPRGRAVDRAQAGAVALPLPP
jgi:hypothetical protein